MKQLLFDATGRITRAKFWLVVLIQILATLVAYILWFALWSVIPGEYVDGSYTVEGARAVPYIAIGFGLAIFAIWSGICAGIKRCHDRDRSGAFLLIQLIPLVGPIWLFIELALLGGTRGPNRFGPDPRDPLG